MRQKNALFPAGDDRNMIRPGAYAVVGAAESTEIGKVPHLSSMGLALDAAANALRDAGLTPADIDGITTGYLPPGDVAQHLGIFPSWADNTVVGGCSWMFQLRNAIAAIHAGYCQTALIVYGESGRSHGALPCVYDIAGPGSASQQFDLPYGGRNFQASLFSLPVLRYMREYGVTEETLATVPVVQREWAAMNPRAKLRDPITTDEVLDSPGDRLADPAGHVLPGIGCGGRNCRDLCRAGCRFSEVSGLCSGNRRGVGNRRREPGGCS